MDNKDSLSCKIEKLRNEISKKINENLDNITIDDIIDKSNELNNLIVEYYRETNKNH